MNARHARRAAAIAVLLVIGMTGARAEGAATLRDVLAGLRDLPGIAFTNVAAWAARPAAPADLPVGTTPFAEVRAERAILALAPRDRDGTLWWLQSRGRRRLHERGADDAEIGPARYPVDTASERGPNTRLTRAMRGWRRLAYGGGAHATEATAEALAPDAAGDRVLVLGGFSVVASDGASELHCISFNNRGAATATAIRWRYDFFDADGTLLTSIADERRGTFAPNVDILSVPNLAAYENPGLGAPHALIDGCRRTDTRNEAAALTRATSFTVTAADITYTPSR